LRRGYTHLLFFVTKNHPDRASCFGPFWAADKAHCFFNTLFEYPRPDLFSPLIQITLIRAHSFLAPIVSTFESLRLKIVNKTADRFDALGADRQLRVVCKSSGNVSIGRFIHFDDPFCEDRETRMMHSILSTIFIIKFISV